MKRTFLIAAVAGFTALGFAQTDPLPKADTILDRYVEVTGGKAAYEKRKNVLETGVLEFKAQGLKGSVTRYSAEPAEEYSVIDIDGVGKIEGGIDNGVAWEKSVIMGPRIKTGAERVQTLREGTFNASLQWRELFPKVETAGVETLDGEPCYKVVLTPKEGNPETMFFEKKSGYAVKTMTVAATQMGDVPFEATSTDYKTFGGVTIPTKITQKVSGQEFSITIQDVKINQPIPEGRFDPPAEIKALLSKSTDKK
jgi:hypothetical protein